MNDANPYEPPRRIPEERPSSPPFDSRARKMPIFVNVVLTGMGVLLSLFVGSFFGMLFCGIGFDAWPMIVRNKPGVTWNEIVIIDTCRIAGATIMLLLFLHNRRAFLSKNYGPDEAGFYQSCEPRDEQELR